MMNFFEHCADIASVGIIVDFTEDTETYIVGSPADIKAWAYSGCPRKAPTGIMWQLQNRYRKKLLLQELLYLPKKNSNTDS